MDLPKRVQSCLSAVTSGDHLFAKLLLQRKVSQRDFEFVILLTFPKLITLNSECCASQAIWSGSITTCLWLDQNQGWRGMATGLRPSILALSNSCSEVLRFRVIHSYNTLQLSCRPAHISSCARVAKRSEEAYSEIPTSMNFSRCSMLKRFGSLLGPTSTSLMDLLMKWCHISSDAHRSVQQWRGYTASWEESFRISVWLCGR